MSEHELLHFAWSTLRHHLKSAEISVHPVSTLLLEHSPSLKFFFEILLGSLNQQNPLTTMMMGRQAQIVNETDRIWSRHFHDSGIAKTRRTRVRSTVTTWRNKESKKCWSSRTSASGLGLYRICLALHCWTANTNQYLSMVIPLSIHASSTSTIAISPENTHPYL